MARANVDYAEGSRAEICAKSGQERRRLQQLRQGDATALWGLWEQYWNSAFLCHGFR